MAIEAKGPEAPSSAPPKRGTDMKDRDLSWFAQRIERGRKEMFAEIVTITPDIARRLLEQNADNRAVSTRYIRQIAHDLRQGHWEINGETIIIAKDGWLNDGQNRLLGIIEADLPAQSFIVFGVSRQSRMTVDMGRARTTGQYLGMGGATSAEICATVASQWAAFTLGYYGKMTKNRHTGITKQDTIAFYHGRKAQIDSAVSLLRTRAKSLGRGTSGVITAYLILRDVDSIHTDGFFHMLIDGANLDREDPILWLRNRLTTNTHDSYQKIEVILRYWMAWKDARLIKKHLSLLGEWPAELEKYGRK